MPETQILIARDHDPYELRVAHRAGALERLRRGAYRAVPDDGASSGDAAMSAVRRRELDRARAVHEQLHAEHWFSHGTAAVLHGLPVWRLPDQVHLVQAYRASSRSAADVRRHVLPVPPEHRVVVGGLSATSLERTVADCVSTMPALEGLVIADAARRRGVDVEEVRRIVMSRYRGRARGLLVLDLSDPDAESAWETWLRYVALWAGLPRPETQVPVTTRLGRFRVDLGWPEHRVLAEFDGLVKYRDGALGADHDAAQLLVDEKLRQDAITESTGITVLRFTSKDGPRPEEVAQRMLVRFPSEIRRAARKNPLLARPR
ncbi:hypothetical protein [Isoptericola variabilis]|uniref:Transcriptional regulator, AbiEi antitoxin, Type IV TA system n=1 Tax=Isoptericola variabilis (strain 225) TaxID=743718 RepID=F6FWN2_ISOV2|nr:hypothetical protein [Isoptericola variabilis]AEG45673.1 hypothetical protein Isova_2995 [Isoptericola variabilis 225]TWH33776.1 Transcriptional regulator, AbiEi antitoxin, Type IV TA system [Isoptericola variabilis J7]